MELMCWRGSLLVQTRVSVWGLPCPSGLLPVGAERDKSCWLIKELEVDNEFFICSNVFLASGLLTGDGLPVIGLSPFLCINSLCKVELRVGPAFDGVCVFGDSKAFPIVDEPMIKPLGLTLVPIDGDIPRRERGELGCKEDVFPDGGDSSVGIPERGEFTLVNISTGTDDEREAIPLFAAPPEESKGDLMLEAPNISSSVEACQKFIFVKGVTLTFWSVVALFPPSSLSGDSSVSCLI